MKRKKLAAAAGALCLLLTACGSKSSSSAESSDPDSAAGTTTTTVNTTAETTTTADSTADEYGENPGCTKLFDTPEEAVRNTISAQNGLNAGLLMNGITKRIVKGLADYYQCSFNEVYERCKEGYAEEAESGEHESIGITIKQKLSPEDLNDENDADGVREYCDDLYGVLETYGYDRDSLSYVVLELNVMYFDAEGTVTEESNVFHPVILLDEGWFDPWAAAIAEEMTDY